MTRKSPRRANGEGFGISLAGFSKPTPNSVNPQGPRLFVQVGRDIDGHKVTLHGYVGGYLTTIVRGLTADEANERAATEAAERGLEVRHGARQD